MSKLKRFLSILMAAILFLGCLSLPAMAEDVEEDEEDLAAQEAEVEKLKEGELIVGHPTITNGDFFTEMFGNNTADIDVRALIHGYNLVNWDQNQGTYVFDPSVVRQVIEQVDEIGNHKYLLVLADNLYYSDGSHITAWDYAFSILLMMSPEIEQIGGKIYRAEHILGYDEYITSRREIIAGQEPEFVDYLAGVRVLSDYQIEIVLDADFLPYFFETGLLMTVPYPISVIAPGCKVVSGIVDPDTGDPYGIKIVNEDESNTTPIYTAELLQKTILDPETGYNTFPSVCSGPYVIKSWDGVTGHYEINPEFKGAWMVNNLPGEDGSLSRSAYRARENGQLYREEDEAGNPYLDADGNEIWLVKPSIERIAFTVADNDTMISELCEGNLHLVNKVTYGKTIVEGINAISDGAALDMDNYNRIGMSFLTFTYDWPTVHDKEVRQAIAWCMDRDLMTEKYCGYEDEETGNVRRFGMTMDGYFGIEQWEHKLVTGQIGYPINFLPTRDALGTPIQFDDDELARREKLMKLKNRFILDDDEEGYEKAVEAWDGLVAQWEDALVHYTVDLKTAKALLVKAGWTLNRNGEAFQEGVDDVRCKLDEEGNLIALDLKMMYPAGNHMAEIMMEEGKDEVIDEETGATRNMVDNLARIGIKLTLVPEPMESLLRSYYRETERTTDMIYLATNFHVIVDPSITYSTDDSVGHAVWNNTYSDDEELFILAKAMRETEPLDYFEYVGEWISFQKRYNEVLPTIPIYSNVYHDFFTEYLQNYEITAQVTWSQAILLAFFGLPGQFEPEEVPANEDEMDMDMDFE